MKRATADSIGQRNFGAVHFWRMRRSLKSQKKLLKINKITENLLFVYFKVVQSYRS